MMNQLLADPLQWVVLNCRKPAPRSAGAHTTMFSAFSFAQISCDFRQPQLHNRSV